MKYVRPAAITATAMALSATSATAGGMAEPIMAMEPEIVMEESAGSSANVLIPLILIALIAAAMSSSSSDSGVPMDMELPV